MYILLAYLASAVGFHFLMLIFMAIAVATRKFRYYLIGAVVQLFSFWGIYSNPLFRSNEQLTWYWVFYLLSLGVFACIVSTPKKHKKVLETNSQETPFEKKSAQETEENNK